MPLDTRHSTVLDGWRRAGADPPSCDDLLACEWHALGHLLVDVAGHGEHGGWTFDPATRETACACGRDPFALPLPALLVWDGTGSPVLAAVAWADGHGRCGGYRRDGDFIVCDCGQLRYEVVPVAPVEAGAA